MARRRRYHRSPRGQWRDVRSVIALPSRRPHRVHVWTRNPGKGINWMPILLIGGAAFLFMRPSGLGFGGGTSVLPPGYTYLGSGYYRGPDGQTYFRNPATGQMAPVSAAQMASGQVTQAGLGVVAGVLPVAASAATSFFTGLIRNLSGGPAEVAPVMGGSVTTSDAIRSGGDVGMVPAPLPDFPELL